MVSKPTLQSQQLKSNGIVDAFHFDRFRGVLKRASNTTAQLAEALDEARTGKADSLAAVERQAKTVAAVFMDADAKRAVDRATLADLRDLTEDAAAIRAELEKRHAAALAADEDGRQLPDLQRPTPYRLESTQAGRSAPMELCSRADIPRHGQVATARPLYFVDKALMSLKDACQSIPNPVN